MTLRAQDVHWLLTMEHFRKAEQKWESNLSPKHLINPDLLQRIDLFFQVIRRFLDSVPHTDENRRKFFKQMIALSYLMGRAEMEMGIPLSDIYL
jgi:hypothetical protein